MSQVMLKVLDLIERSIIVQSLVTLSFVGVALVMWAQGRVVPDGMQQGLWVLLGFWFGTKVQHSIDENLKARGV